MAHRLLHKLSFSRKHSVPTVPSISPDLSSDAAAVPPLQGPPSSSAVLSTSPTVYPHCSNPPIPLVVLPLPDFHPCPGTRKPYQRVNLFKKLLGKQLVPPRLTASKTRPKETWERELQEFQFDAGAGARGGDSEESSSKVKTPTSWELHWDCAKTVYRDSTEVRTPVFSREGLALFDLPSPAGLLSPIDYRTARRSTTDLWFKETSSPNGRWNNKNDAYPPSESPVVRTHPPPSPSGYSINSVSSTYDREQDVIISQVLGSLNEEEEPCCSAPQFGPPKRGREPRPISLVLRPTSSGGPALQVLSPPPVRASLAARRGTTLPSPLPPVASPRRQSRQPTRHPRHLHESAHDVSEPRSSASLTPEEGLVQLQIRTQRADSNTPLRYRRSFRHVRGLTPRTLPTASRSLQLSITATPVNARLDSLDDDKIQSESEESPVESVSASSSDGSGPLSTPPDDTVPGITITRSRKGSSATSKYAHSSMSVKGDKYASSFLDFEPGTPLSPPSPAAQSPFSVAQSQLFIYNNLYACDSDDGPAEQGYAGTSTDNHKKQRDRGARRRASPIPRSKIDNIHGSKTRPGTLSPSMLGTGARQSVHSIGKKTRSSGTSSAYSMRAVGKSHRRRRSGAVRRSHRPSSRSGNNVTRRSGNRGPSGTTTVIGGVGLCPEIGSRARNNGPSPSRVAR